MSVRGGVQMKQLSLFDTDKETVKITKPIRLIELFAGYGSQAMAMKRLVRYQMTEASVEQYLVIESLLQLLLQGVMAMQINMFTICGQNTRDFSHEMNGFRYYPYSTISHSKHCIIY